MPSTVSAPENWASRRYRAYRSPYFAAFLTLLGIIAGGLGSIFSPEIRAAWPFYWGPGKVSPEAVSFWLTALTFALLFFLPGEPVTRHVAAYWLKQAYELSQMPKPDGSLWHAFRRLWATERKNLPVKDVAAAGGWKDTTTLIECYQQPDEETLRSVVEFERPRTQTQVRTSGARP